MKDFLWVILAVTFLLPPLPAICQSPHYRDAYLVYARKKDSITQSRRNAIRETPQEFENTVLYLETLVEQNQLDSADALLHRYNSQIPLRASRDLQFRFVNAWAKLLMEQNRTDSAISLLQQTINSPLFDDQPFYNKKLLALSGTIWFHKGNFVDASLQLSEAATYFKANQDSLEYYKCRVDIASIQMKQYNYGIARNIYFDALHYARKSGNKELEAKTLSLLGILSYRKDLYQEGSLLASAAYDLFEQLEKPKGLSMALMNIAINQMALEDWRAAISTLKRTQYLDSLINDYSSMPIILNNLGISYLYAGRPDSALVYFGEAFRTNADTSNLEALSQSHLWSATVYAEKENFRKAYEHLEQYEKLRLTHFNRERAGVIINEEAKARQREARQKIAFLKQKNELLLTRNIFGLIAGIFMLIILVFIIYAIRYKLRKERQLYSKEKEVLEANEIITRQELQITRQELLVKEQELAAFISQIIEKNNLLESLKSKVATLEEVTKGEEQEKQSELILQMSNLRILTDDDWVIFKGKFDQVYPNLIRNLRRKYSQLSMGDERMFLLMKLNFDEILMTNILGISRNAIKKAKYRLVKRLDLEDVSKLEEFVQKYE